MRIDIDIQADDVFHILDRLDTAFSPEGMSRFMATQALPHLRARAKGRFEGEGDDASGKWAPLKDSTVSIRASGIRTGLWPDILPDHPINQRTGIMHDYIVKGRAEIMTTDASTTMFFPGRRPPTPQLMKKVQRAQQGDRRTQPRPVLAISQVDVNELSVRLAYFIGRVVTGNGVV